MDDGFSIRPPLQIDTPTRSAVSLDQPLSVQDFLRSLKKPTRPLPTPIRVAAPQNNASPNCQLTVQGFLYGLRKPVAAYRNRTKTAEDPKLQLSALTGYEGLPILDSVATVPGPGLLDPPQSIPNDTDREQILHPSPEARRLRSPDPKGPDEKDVSMTIPRVVLTYTKKAKHVLPQRNESTSLFLTQSSPHKGALLDGLLDDGSDAPIEQMSSREIPKPRSAKKHTSVASQKRKQQPLREDEEDHREHRSQDEADVIQKEEKKRNKRKKRRVPVNELALVTTVPSHEDSPTKTQRVYDSDNAIDLLNECLEGQGIPASASPSLERSRQPKRANRLKPITRIREEITIPQHELLAREDFKFPPMTPKTTRSSGWKLGSGFDGMTLEPCIEKRPQISRNRKFWHARAPCFLGCSLEFSTGLSPTRQSYGQRDILKRREIQGSPAEIRRHKPALRLNTNEGAADDGPPHKAAETDGKAALEQVAGLTALFLPPTEKCRSGTASSPRRKRVVMEPNRQHQSQTRDLDMRQAIRGPSKSERTGWLKRRLVTFAVSDEDEEQLFVHTQKSSVIASDIGKRTRRVGLDTNPEDIAQAQHVICDDLHALDEQLKQNSPAPERPDSSRQQFILQDERSAEENRRRALHDTERQASDSGDEILDHQNSSGPAQPPSPSNFDPEFPPSPLRIKSLSKPKPKPKHHIQVPETQTKPPKSTTELDDHCRTKSLDWVGPLHSHGIPAIATLDSGKYFSKAVRQLDGRGKGAQHHVVTRRRSRREPDQDVRVGQKIFGTRRGARHVSVAPITDERGSGEQEGILELGVTARLKRRMSNVPFRPPFKEALR